MAAFNAKLSKSAVNVGKNGKRKSKKSPITPEDKEKRSRVTSFLLLCQEKREEIKVTGQKLS
jgi:hypothetical protein